jgi:hypothetical protein
MDDFTTNLILSRLTYGPTASSRSKLTSMGLKSWLSKELAGISPEQSIFLVNKDAFPSANQTLAQTIENPLYRRRAYWVSRELAALTTLRRIYSSNQVLETLAEHFADYLPVPLFSQADIFRMDYDRTIRANLNKTYPELLVAAAFHPAMLISLNGQTNTAASPNENFGRELLELFTVTPKFKFTEKDVLQASLMLTGINFSLASMELRAIPSRHHFGKISLLGFSHSNLPTDSPSTIIARATQMIKHLALLPSTAEAFSIRMARRYVSEIPSKKLLDLMKRTYMATKGSIPAVFSAMVLSPEFLSSKPSKVKRPAEHLASSVRALNVELSAKLKDMAGAGSLGFNDLNPLTTILDRQGHLPFDWGTPDGYPDYSDAWTTFGGQAQRWNLTSKISQGAMRGVFTIPAYASLLSQSTSVSAVIDQVVKITLSSPLRAGDKQRMVSLIEANVVRTQTPQQQFAKISSMAFGLVMATEEWNLR